MSGANEVRTCGVEGRRVEEKNQAAYLIFSAQGAELGSIRLRS